MAYLQIRDVVRSGYKLHQKLAKAYEQSEAAATNERMRMSHAYLRTHEESLATTMSNYEHDLAPSTLDTWFQILPPLETREIYNRLENDNLTEIHEMQLFAASCHDLLIDWYQQFYNEAQVESVEDAMAGLIQLEKAEKLQIVRNLNYMNDL